MTEIDRSRAEDPGFPAFLARARALAKNVPYRPEIHGPFDGNRKHIDSFVVPEHVERIEETIEKWAGRGRQRSPVHPMRENVRKDLA